jgi:hypothetical protein
VYFERGDETGKEMIIMKQNMLAAHHEGNSDQRSCFGIIVVSLWYQIVFYRQEPGVLHGTGCMEVGVHEDMNDLSR